MSQPEPTLQSRLCALVQRAPDGPAVAFMDEAERLSWRSLGNFFDTGLGRAAVLSDCGLGRGDVCVIMLPSTAGCAEALLGTLLVGAVPLLVAPPVAGAEPPQALADVIRRTSARWLVTDRKMLAGRGAPRGVQVIDAPQLLTGHDGSARLDPVQPRAADVAAMQLTSGATGRPRVCVWQQRQVLAALDGMRRAMKLVEEDVCFNWTPLYHDMGLVNNFLLCLTAGVPLVLMAPQVFMRDPGIWLRGLSASAATTTWSPNFGFALVTRRVPDAALAGVDLSRVRAFWNAAERVHASTMIAFHRRFAACGVRFEAMKANFGCAENVGGATFSALHEPFKVEYLERQALQERRVAQAVAVGEVCDDAVCVAGVGRPCPGMTAHVLGRDGRPLPDGRVGEIALRTPSMMQGYVRDAAATRRAIGSGLLRTGDLGYARAGELYWVGRVRERITVRGVKIDPSAFEPVLFEIAGLRPGCFVAFGIDDAEAGSERVVIITEVREPLTRNAELMRSEIQKECVMRVGVPVTDVLLVRPGTLTKTSSGKRRHRHFRELYRTGKLAPQSIGAGPAPVSARHLAAPAKPPAAGSTEAPPTTFDPLIGQAIARHDRPAGVEAVATAQLSRFHRAVLSLDGTVTRFLEAWALEPVRVLRLSHHWRTLIADDDGLQADQGSRVLVRQAALQGGYSGALFSCATAELVIARIPASAIEDLNQNPGGLGRTLLSSGMESRRELLWFGRMGGDRLPLVFRHLGGQRFVVRTYRLVAGGLPVVRITERFPDPPPAPPVSAPV